MNVITSFTFHEYTGWEKYFLYHNKKGKIIRMNVSNAAEKILNHPLKQEFRGHSNLPLQQNNLR
jgi:hypothetical protein